jgi:hypothetical protein
MLASTIFISSPQTSVYLVNTTHPKVFILPAVSTVPGLFLTFKDFYGSASNYTTTLSTSGIDKIENIVNYYTFSNNYGAINLLNDGISNWSILDISQGTDFTSILGPSNINYTIGGGGASANFTTTVSFSYTGSNQTFTVPNNVGYIGVYMWGAGGSRGVAGAMVQGVLEVSPGEILNILVGQGGLANATNSYGGGGKGGIQNGSGQLGGSGGGRSAIQRGGTDPMNDIVVAGGGGGANPYFGSSGGAATFSGTANDGTSKTGVQGRGGTQTAGGAGGGTGQYGTGLPGSRGLGGDTVNGGYNGGGGGGGGYYGGGAGGTNGGDGAGGGGGSSLISNLTLLPDQTVFGYNSTNGIAAPNQESPYYVSGVGQGGGTSGSANPGGNGLVVIRY